MAGQPIVISILANASQANRTLQQTATTTQKVGAGFRKMAAPAAAALGVLVAGGAKAADAAAEDAQSQTVLATALQRSTKATAAQVAATEDFIDKTARATGVADDQLRPAMATLARSTGSVEKSQKALGLALDISAATGKDVGAVSQALAKGYGGTTTALGRLVPGLDAAIVKSGDMNKITAELARLTGGTAAKAAATEAGQRARANVAMDEAVETIGGRLLPVYAKAAQAGAAAANWLAENEKKAAVLAGTIGGLAVVVLTVNAAMKVASAVTAIYNGVLIAASGVSKAAAAAQWVLNAALTANPIGLVVVAIAALAAGLVFAYKKSETFRNIVNKAFSGISKAITTAVDFVVGFVKKNWKLLPLLLLGPIGIAVIAVIKNWNKVKAATTAAWNGIKAVVTGAAGAVKSVISGQFNLVRAAIVGAWNAAKSATTSVWSGIKGAVSSAVNTVMGTVSGIKGRVLGVFTGAATWLLSAGKDIIQGLLDGIESMIGAVTDKLGKLTKLIPDVKGPPAKDRVLLRSAGQLIMKGLVDGLDDGEDGVERSLTRLTSRIQSFFDKRFKNDAKAAAHSKAALKALRDEYAALTKNAKAQDRISAALEKARQKLADVRTEAANYAKSIRDSFVTYGSITSLGEGVGYANADQMLSVLRAKVDQAKQYAAMIKQLIAKGLNKTTIQQLLDAGVEGGLGAAQTLLSGGATVVNEVNALTAQLASAGQGLGDKAADSMYGVGIKTAQGVVDGLEREEKRLDRVAKRMARTLVREVNDVLDDYAKKGGAASQKTTVSVRLTAQQSSQLQRGKEIIADIDVARGAGVKFKAA